MSFMEYTSKQAQYLPALPQGEDTTESMWGTPELSPSEPSITGKIIGFYKDYWTGIGKILTGRGNELMDEGNGVITIGDGDTAPSVGWIVVLGVVAGSLYYFKKRG